MVLVLAPAAVERVVALLAERGVTAWPMGRIEAPSPALDSSFRFL
jgi:phosphoribosylaminoimidazole (AIR) synthetase